LSASTEKVFTSPKDRKQRVERAFVGSANIYQQQRFKQSAETKSLQSLPLVHIPFHLLSKNLRRVNFR